jgi:viologen exporter family transport system permease protein
LRLLTPTVHMRGDEAQPRPGDQTGWRAYAALSRMAFQRQLAYRFANISGLLTNGFFGLLRAYVLIALFGARQNVAGYSIRDAVTYTALTQGLIAYVAIFGWWDLMRSIRTGEVASDLARPLDFFWYWCAQDFGRAAAQLLVRGLPILAAYALVFQITLPPTPLHALALLAALALALFISFCWRFMVSLSAFWMQDAIGIGRMAWIVATFLSGFLMPVAFLPNWMQTFMHGTFFPAMINTVVEVYLGLLTGPALLSALAAQLLWAFLLYALARLVLAAGVRKLVIQGG